MKRLFFVLFSLVFIITNLYGKPNYVFRTLSPEGGFYHEGVNSVRQDGGGFIWVLMEGALYRFDGYQYINYLNYFKNIDNSTKWTFQSIETDVAGNLYLIANNKLYYKQKDSEKFDCIIDTAIVKLLSVDSFNNIWAITTGGLRLYNPITSVFEPISSDNGFLNNVFRFWNVGDKIYAVSVWGTIYLIDKDNKSAKRYASLPKNNYYYEIIFDNNKLWALTNKKGLLCINFDNITIEKEYNFFDNPKALYIDELKHLWVGTQKGLYIINPYDDTYGLYKYSKNESFSIPNNSVWSINEDRQKNIWIGTYSGGLCYVNVNEQTHFNSYTPKESNMNYYIVSGFAENDKTLWVSTDGGGVNCIDKQTGLFTYLQHHPNTNSLTSNNVKSMVFDSVRNNLWISTYKGGLNRYNIKSKTFTSYKHVYKDNSTLYCDDIRKIVDADSGIWIIYQHPNTIFSYYSYTNETFTHLDLDKGQHYLFDVCMSPNGNLLFVSHNILYIFDTKTKVVEQVPLNLYGRTLYLDNVDNVWIGTSGKGLAKYNLNNKSLHIYDDILKYHASSIYSINADNEGNLWLGTDNGLFRYNPEENVFMMFNKDDGVQGNIFYPLASMKNKDNKLFFGGTNGFTIVSPEFLPNMQKPNSIISDIFVDNKSVMFDSTSVVWNRKNKNEIILNHKQANIGFRFSSNNYLVPLKNKYKFRLKGYDDRWVETDAFNRNAYFTKIPPGKYVFELLASNNDGVWSETPTTIDIMRLPAFWESLYAYILYALFPLLIMLLIMRYYNKQKQLKLALYKENLDKQQREEIHQSQLRFFTNISHDFRTPLSLILATLQTLRNEGLKEYYYNILNNNSQRLLNLVNELMLFRTIENGKMSLILQESDINSGITSIASDFNDYAEQNKIVYHIKCDNSLPENILMDKSVFEKVVVNLLNNAFKFTHKGGQISITSYSDVKHFKSEYKTSFTVGNEDPGNHFCIVVHDTGVGISPESITKIFERFYKVKSTEKDNHLGTGIGLALVKSLVMLHKGTITVYSDRDKGTDILVSFSKNTNIYAGEEIILRESLSIKKNIATEAIETEKEEADNNVFFREDKRILVVEDNDDLRHLISNFLSSHYSVIEAANAIIATETLGNMEIDLIISDIMMPLKDGISFCAEIKNDIATSHIPFILLTAKTSVESKIEGMDSGADVYLEKPIYFDLLLTTIKNIFKHRQQLKEYYAKNYFADVSELRYNQQNNKFLKQFVDLLENNIDQADFDVNFIATELSMSRSKLYSKIKSMTDKSIVEFVLSYRLRKAARLIVEEDLSIAEIMGMIGIESQSYFTRAFKKEFGETPTAFATKHKKNIKAK